MADEVFTRKLSLRVISELENGDNIYNHLKDFGIDEKAWFAAATKGEDSSVREARTVVLEDIPLTDAQCQAILNSAFTLPVSYIQVSTMEDKQKCDDLGMVRTYYKDKHSISMIYGDGETRVADLISYEKVPIPRIMTLYVDKEIGFEKVGNVFDEALAKAGISQEAIESDGLSIREFGDEICLSINDLRITDSQMKALLSQSVFKESSFISINYFEADQLGFDRKALEQRGVFVEMSGTSLNKNDNETREGLEVEKSELERENELLKQQLAEANLKLESMDVVIKQIQEEQATIYKQLNKTTIDKIKDVQSKMIEGITNVVRSTQDFLAKSGRFAIELGGDFYKAWAEYGKKAVDNITSLKNKADTQFTKFVDNAHQLADKTIDKIQAQGLQTIQNIKESPIKAEMFLVKFRAAARETVENFRTGFNDLADKFVKGFNATVENTKVSLVNAKTKFLDTIANIKEGVDVQKQKLVDVIKEGIETDKKTFESIKLNIKDFIIERQELKAIDEMYKPFQEHHAKTGNMEMYKTNKEAIKDLKTETKEAHKAARKANMERD